MISPFYKKLFLRASAVLFTLALSFFGARLIFAFVGPTANPPGGTAAIDVNSSNYLGIGVAADTTAKMIIQNTGGAAPYALKVQNGVSAPALFVKSDGSVGVATGTFASVGTAALSVQGNLIVNGTITGTFTGSIGGADTTISATNVTAGRFGTCATCSIGDYAFPQKLGVNTTTQVSLPQPFASYGGAYFDNNVGVGKTAPTFRLHVKSEASGGGIAIERSAIGADTVLRFKNQNGTDRGKILFGGTNEEISFFAGDGNTEHARITSAGYLGIATTTPAYPLSVQGDINTNVGVYRKDGTAGVTRTCAQGEVISSTTVSGGIITRGSCVSLTSGLTISAEDVIAGSFGANQGYGNYIFRDKISVGTTTIPTHPVYVGAGGIKVAASQATVNDMLVVGGGFAVPAGFTVDVSGGLPVLNFDINERHTTRNTAYRGATFNVRNGDNPEQPFYWSFREAGQSSDYWMMSLGPPNSANLTGGLQLYDSTFASKVKFTWGYSTAVSYVTDGGFGIGTSSMNTVSEKLRVLGNARIGTGTDGCLYDNDYTTLTGTCSSDIRFKKNITSLSSVLDRVVQLQPVYYQWGENAPSGFRSSAGTHLGLTAQDVEKVLPELVTTDEHGYKAVHYEQLPFYMLQAIKEQQGIINDLRARIEVLEEQADN